jgi:hypothetical protein
MKVKFQVAPMGCKNKHYTREGQQAKVVTRFGINQGAIRRSNTAQENIAQLPKATEHEIFAKIHARLVFTEVSTR